MRCEWPRRDALEFFVVLASGNGEINDLHWEAGAGSA